MTQLNLLPAETRDTVVSQQRDAKTKRTLRLVAVGCLVILFILGAVFAILRTADQNLSAQIDEKLGILNAQNTKGELDNLLTIQQQLSQLDGLHAGKPLFSRLLNLVGQLSAGVNLSSISLKDGKTLGLTGTTQDFPSFDAYKQLLQSSQISFSNSNGPQTVNLFSSVDVGEATASGSGTVNFRINAAYNPAVLSIASQNVKLVQKGGN